jgi:hypothetical protein
VTTDPLTSTPTQFQIIRAVSIIYNTAADIIIKGFDPRTKRLPKFNLNSSDKTLLNFSDKLQSINKILSAWCWRDLTFIEKITVTRKYFSPDPCLEPIHIASVLSKFTFKPEHSEKRDSICNDFSND